MEIPQYALSIDHEKQIFEFSICTLVTRKEEYTEMLASFNKAGFTPEICEFLYLDNSIANKFDGFKGLNLFLKQARGKYIIICHQDILMDKDNIDDLRKQLITLEKTDSNWAICGNAGAMGPNHIVYHISYPTGELMSKGKFPVKVSSLDENFILVKNSASLSLAKNLTGFHLYATDLCLNAELNGFNSYVIRFNLTHKSRGNLSPDFFEIRKELIKNYNHFFRGRWIQTTFTVFYLSGSIFSRFYGNPITLFFVRIKNSIYKKLG